MKPKETIIKKKKLFQTGIMLLLILFSIGLYAQDLSPAEDYEFTGFANESMTIVINATSTTAPHSWSFSSVPFTNDPTGNMSLVGTPPETSATYTLSVNPMGLLVNEQYAFRVTMQDNDGAEIVRRYFLRFTPRPPIDIMFALDRSGSMSQPADNNGGSESKQDVMEAATENFLVLLDAFKVEGDRAGAIFFDDTREDFEIGGVDGLHPFTGGTAISDALRNFPPAGYTCIGGALIDAHAELQAGDRSRRHIILMSDGIQNREPSFDVTTKTIDIRGSNTISSDFGTGPLNLSTLADGTIIHTIAVGDNAVTSLMQNIAEANNDNELDGIPLATNSTADFTADMNDFFDNIFTKMLEDFSPAIVNKKIINLTRGVVATNTFSINETADRIFIKVVGIPGEIKGMNMEVEKDGVLFANDIGRTSSMVYFAMDKKKLLERGANVGGDWIVRLSGQTAKFNLSALVNDEYIEYDTKMADGQVAPGESLNLMTKIKVNGNPVTNLTQAKVLLLKPGQDLNDLYAQANSSIDPPAGWTGEPDVNPGQDKYEKLIALDQGFINSLIPQENVINLNNNGDGTYSATFNQTEESGVYKAYFYMKGSNPQQGNFERLKLLTTTIDFGEADESQSTFSIIEIDDNTFQFIITPKNRFGHLIGPNRLGQIAILVDGNAVQLTDNLDGSYQAIVPSSGFFNTNPDVQVGIKGTTFYEGKYSDIDGANLSFFDLYRPWIILLILLIIIILAIIRKIKKP